MLKLLNLTEIT